MTEFLRFFEDMPTWQKAVWVLLCLSASWAIEARKPLFRLGYNKWRHARSNLVLLAIALSINTVFTVAAIGVFAWVNQHEMGLLHWVALPVWLELLLALLFLDLIAQYVAHLLLHKVDWMWRFHMVHHSDVNVDATTGARVHPIDYCVREVFALLAIVVVGVPFAFYIVYRLSTIFFAFITHANIEVPLWLDRPLCYVFVTPNLHKFHHHYALPWTDTNYGNIFSIWDRLFRTLVYADLTRIRYGLNTLPDHEDENLLFLLKLPFDRAAWGFKRGTPLERPGAETESAH
jgi:sterol desaturase/sphingolipid hydroxylase (fatty acid hydroxylase superfamily)